MTVFVSIFPGILTAEQSVAVKIPTFNTLSLSDLWLCVILHFLVSSIVQLDQIVLNIFALVYFTKMKQ